MQKNDNLIHKIRLNYRWIAMTLQSLAVFLLISTIPTFAFSQALKAMKIEIHVENANIKTALREIQKNSQVKFFYGKDVDQYSHLKVSITNQQKNVLSAIQKVLSETDLRFTQKGLHVLIDKKSDDDNITKAEGIARQDRTISGTVTDAEGNPLAGVTVQVKNSTIQTSTNDEGKYQLNIPADKDTIIISHVGFQTVEIAVASRTQIDISLDSLLSDLDEVVVVAYGTQKKETLTGAISTIKTKEIKQSPAANLAVTLTGRLPGLFIQQTSGEPGRDFAQMYLRGVGTLNGTSPIILVDGVERELTALDPNEVESVSILKDASSTALFGVRGANGVILVTTKRGTESVPQISLSSEFGLQGFTRMPSVLSGYEWASLKNQAYKNDFPSGTALPYSEYALERFRLQDFLEAYPNNDWVDTLMHQYVPQQRYNLTLNGKGANVGYFVNVGYLDQKGQWKIDPSVDEYDPTQYLKRYNFRANIDADLNKSKTLRTFLNAAGFLERVNGPAVSSNTIIDRVLYYWPVVQPGPTTPDGEVMIGNGNIIENPWAMINRSGYTQESRSNLTASWGLEQKLIFLTKGLSTKLMVSFDTKTNYNLTGSKQYQYWVQVIDPNSQTSDGRDSIFYQRIRTDYDNTPLATSIGSNFRSFYEIQWHLNYSRNFANHAVSGLILAQQQSLIKPNIHLPFNVRGMAGRFTYSYAGRYMAEFNFGYNGSEQFTKGNRYGFFPSFSLGWNVHQESFFQVASDIVTQLKIRGSYGEVGNDQLGDRRFLYLDDIQVAGGGFSSSLGRGRYVNESFYGNLNLKWEVAKKTNLGLELSILKDLRITADVFKEKRDNILITRNSSPVLVGLPSASLAPANIGVIVNKGFEVELDYQKKVNPSFGMFSKINLNYAKNKVLFADEVLRPEGYVFRNRVTGYQIGQQWGYIADGFFSTQDEIDDYAIYQGLSPRIGDLKYVDLNGDGYIDEADYAPMRYSTLPQYSWGAALGVNLKSFDLSVLFQGAFKVSGQFNAWETNNFRSIHLDAWTPEKDANGEAILWPALTTATSASHTSNSFFSENRSFIRLKNLELGYHLPHSVLSKVGMRQVRFYANGLNLITWDRKKQKDWDPELLGTTSYPVYRVFNFGVNIQF